MGGYIEEAMANPKVSDKMKNDDGYIYYGYMCHKIALGTDQNQNKNVTKILDFANVNCSNHLSTFVVRNLLNDVACVPNAFSKRENTVSMHLSL